MHGKAPPSRGAFFGDGLLMRRQADFDAFEHDRESLLAVSHFG
jgi:hypothetical protein